MSKPTFVFDLLVSFDFNLVRNYSHLDFFFLFFLFFLHKKKEERERKREWKWKRRGKREEEMRLFLDSGNKKAKNITHMSKGRRWDYLRVHIFYNRSLERKKERKKERKERHFVNYF